MSSNASLRTIKALITWIFRKTIKIFMILIALPVLYGVVSSLLVLEPLLKKNLDSPTTFPSGGVVLYIWRDQVHTDLILPIHTVYHDWRLDFPDRDILSPDPLDTWMSIGWGSKDFYLHTREWADLTVERALQASLGLGGSLLHVSRVSDAQIQHWAQSPQSTYSSTSKLYTITITPTQYINLVANIRSQFDTKLRASSPPPMAPQVIAHAHYNNKDAFYESASRYHLFKTCNVWLGAQLHHIGVPVSRWTPLAWQVTAHLSPAERPKP